MFRLGRDGRFEDGRQASLNPPHVAESEIMSEVSFNLIEEVVEALKVAQGPIDPELEAKAEEIVRDLFVIFE